MRRCVEPERNALEVSDDRLPGRRRALRPAVRRRGRHRSQGAGGQSERPGGDGRRAARRAVVARAAAGLARGAASTRCSTACPRSPLAHASSLVGGNIARSPGPLVVDVTATGSVHRRRVLTRGGAPRRRRPLRHRHARRIRGRPEDASSGHRRAPGVRRRSLSTAGATDAFGLMLGRNRAARACIDLSDGLADGVRQIGEASGLGSDRRGRRRAHSRKAPTCTMPWRGRRLRAPVCGLTQNALATEKREASGEGSRGHAHRASDGRSRDAVVPQRQQSEELPTGFAHFA